MPLRCTHRPWHKPTCAEARASQGNTLRARVRSACTPAPHTQAKTAQPHEQHHRCVQAARSGTTATATNRQHPNTHADPAAATGLNTHTDGTEHNNCCTNQPARTTARCLTHVVLPPSQRPPPLKAAAAAELPRPPAPTRCRRATSAAARAPEKRRKEPLTGAQHRPPASCNAALHHLLPEAHGCPRLLPTASTRSSRLQQCSPAPA